MSPDATALYRRLRGDLLRATQHHRRAGRPAGFATDIHLTHLEVCRRQLGALRQAYRRTRNAARWNAYAQARARRAAGYGPEAGA